jgi:hypothetical protein
VLLYRMNLPLLLMIVRSMYDVPTRRLGP